MFNPFSPNMVRPKLPLRKPLSSPMASATSASPRQLAMPDALVLPPGPVNSQIKDTSVLLPSTLPTERVYYCTYCGQQGHFRCKRCKKTPYCSVVCQTEDWMAHRRMCKPPDPEPVKEKPLETTVSPGTGNSPGVLGSKPGDASSHQKIFFKDLHIIKATKGTDIQANVVEFYSPGRFFILPQNSELMDVLQIISTELQKTYIFPPIATYIPCVGEVCAVQYSHDMNWYRGLVQTLDADQRMANILYIDFGNEEHVPLDRIQQLVINIQPFGPCAMECSIAGVEPVCGNWSAECSIALRKLLAGKTVTVKLVEKVEHSHIHAVDILLSMGKVSTFLIERGYAAQRAISITPTEQEIQDLEVRDEILPQVKEFRYLGVLFMSEGLMEQEIDSWICAASALIRRGKEGDAMIGVSLENFRRCSGGKDDNTWALPPEPLTQAVGDSFSVLITHLQSPNEFIVQKVENAGLIQKLQMKLREHCYQSAAPQNFRPAPGTVCCAQFSEDKQWYRAKVLAYSSEARVCVGYLDFGNSEEVDLGHLRPISPPLLAIPMQAIPCGLAGLQPVGENWSEECILALQRRVSNRILRIEIHGAHEGKALVALIDEASDPQANVAELLTSAGFSTPVTVTNSDEQADQKVAAAAELHALATSSDPLTWSWAELPCDSQTVALLACVVENPQDFYCHISNPKDLQQLTELGPELKKHCAANESLFVAKVGDPCCVMLPADEECYRAVVSVLSEDMVSVNLVDYGHRITLDKNNLRSITPRLLSLPFQAVHCSLADVEPLGSEWSIEALLRFQTLVDGETLSARALSVSERGYNVKLESRGQDVAATLISEHLAKAPGAVPKDTYVAFKSEAKRDEKIEESEDCTVHVEAPNQLGAVSKETATKVTAIKAEAPSFPVDWKTVELPVNETFQPCIAAVISPSLFYLLGPSQVDQQKRRQMMMELASYCSNNNFLSSSSSLSRPVPGAACCAKFSADNLWYRAVVLEVGENEMSVIYADYGNTENVPFSRILPIPMHLLQLPFQITRCTLTGNEHFPAEWPEEVQKLFKNLLSQKVLATVQSFDGSANVLSLTQCTESGGGQLTAMILGLLQAKRNPSPSTPPKAEDTDSTAVVAECRQPEPVPETQKGLEEAPATIVQTTTVELTPWTPQTNNSLAASFKEPQTPGCCCVSLKNKIDHLEELLQLQLCLIKQLLQQK